MGDCFLWLLGLSLTPYCVRYLHAVPFLKNEMPYSLLKPPKIQKYRGVLGSKCLKLEK